jgi:hypothetical protein
MLLESAHTNELIDKVAKHAESKSFPRNVWATSIERNIAMYGLGTALRNAVLRCCDANLPPGQPRGA